jgi:hypothetical protein
LRSKCPASCCKEVTNAVMLYNAPEKYPEQNQIPHSHSKIMSAQCLIRSINKFRQDKESSTGTSSRSQIHMSSSSDNKK